MTINYDWLPVHLRDDMRLYIEDGVKPGGFLQAVVCNDLSGAVRTADGVSFEALPLIVRFLRDEVPAQCHGSDLRMHRWIECGGEKGMAA